MKPALLLIVSEQLAPHLESIGHYMQNAPGPLRALRIAHTSDRERSLLPALRLLQLARKTFPDLDVRRFEVPTEPAGVLQRLTQEIASAPGPWIVNASGGLKSMTFGVAPLLQRGDVTVIYSELGAGWLKIHADLTTLRLAISSNSDWLPVDEFIRCQDQEHSAFRFTSHTGASFALPRGVSLANIIRETASKHWRWHEVPALAPPGFFGRDEAEAGFFFERFIGAALLTMGIRNFIGGVKTLSSENLPLEECDFCILHQGRLVHIDCSIGRPGGAKGSYVTQINDAWTRAKMLGGRDARAVLIRPRPPHPRREVIELAQAKQVALIGADDWCKPGALFQRLAAIFSIKQLPENLQAAQAELDRCNSARPRNG